MSYNCYNDLHNIPQGSFTPFEEQPVDAVNLNNGRNANRHDTARPQGNHDDLKATYIDQSATRQSNCARNSFPIDTGIIIQIGTVMIFMIHTNTCKWRQHPIHVIVLMRAHMLTAQITML